MSNNYFSDILGIRDQAQQEVYNMFVDPSSMPSSMWQRGGSILRWNQNELFEGVHTFPDTVERINTSDNALLDSKLKKSKQIKEQQENTMNVAYSMVGAKYLEDFYAQYLEADGKFRLGEVVGTKPDPAIGEVDPIHTPYTDALGHYFTIASFTDRFDSSDNNSDFYVNYLFAPYRLMDWSEILDETNEKYSKIKDWYTTNCAQGLTTGFNSRGEFTYRAPSYKSLNDSIMHIQWLFEMLTGIVSTYVPEWDLSVYIQEGLISNAAGAQPSYISLLHRVDMDTPEAGASTQDAFYLTNYAVTNAAVSILHKTNYEEWDPTLNKYSVYWTPYPTTEESATNIRSIDWNRTGDYYGSLSSFWARDEGFDGYNNDRLVDGSTVYEAGEKKVKDGWSVYRFPFWFEEAYDSNEYTYDGAGYTQMWDSRGRYTGPFVDTSVNAFSGKPFYLNQYMQDMENLALSDYTSSKLCYYNAFYITGHDVTNANENFLTEAQTGAWLKRDVYNTHLENNLGNSWISARKSLAGLTNINAHDPGYADTSYNSTGVNNSGIGTFSGSAGKYGLTPFGVVRAILEFLNSLFRKKSAASAAVRNAMSSFGSSGLAASLGTSASTASQNLGNSAIYDEEEESGSTKAGITGSLTDSLKELATTVGIPAMNPAYYGGPHGQSLAPTSLVSSAQTNNKFLRSVPRMNPETYIAPTSNTFYYKCWNVRPSLDRMPTRRSWRPYHYDGPETCFVPSAYLPFGKSYSDVCQMQSGTKSTKTYVTWNRSSWVANFVSASNGTIYTDNYSGSTAIVEIYDGAFQDCGNYYWLRRQDTKNADGITFITKSASWLYWRWKRKGYVPGCRGHYTALWIFEHTRVHPHYKNGFVPQMRELKYITNYRYVGGKTIDVYQNTHEGCSCGGRNGSYTKVGTRRIGSIVGNIRTWSWTPSPRDPWNAYDTRWQDIYVNAFGYGWQDGSKQWQVSEKWWHTFYNTTLEDMQIAKPNLKWLMFDSPYGGFRFMPYNNDWYYSGGMYYGGWQRMHTLSEWWLYTHLSYPITVDLPLIGSWTMDMNSQQTAMARNVTLRRGTYGVRVYWWHRYKHKRHSDSDWHYYVVGDWMIVATVNYNNVVPVVSESQTYKANNISITNTTIEDGKGHTVTVPGPVVRNSDEANSFFQMRMADASGNVKSSMLPYCLRISNPYWQWIYYQYHCWLPHGINMTSNNVQWATNLWWCQTGLKGRGIFAGFKLNLESGSNVIQFFDSTDRMYKREYRYVGGHWNWWQTWQYPRMRTWEEDINHTNTTRFLYRYLTQAMFFPTDTQPDLIAFVDLSVPNKLAYLQAVYTIKATMKVRDFFMNMLDHFDSGEFLQLMQNYIPPKERFYAGDPTLDLFVANEKANGNGQFMVSNKTWHTSKMYGYNYWLDYAIGLFYYFNAEGKHTMKTLVDLKQTLKNAFNYKIQNLYKVVDAAGLSRWHWELRSRRESYIVQRVQPIPHYAWHWVNRAQHVTNPRAGKSNFWVWAGQSTAKTLGEAWTRLQNTHVKGQTATHSFWAWATSLISTKSYHESLRDGSWYRVVNYNWTWNSAKKASGWNWWRDYWVWERYVAYYTYRRWNETRWRTVYWWEKVIDQTDYLKNAVAYGVPYLKGSNRVDFLTGSWRKFSNIYKDAINYEVYGYYSNIVQNFVYAYLNVLYEAKKTLIEFRMNKQDGTYWTLRQLEKAIPNILNSLTVLTPGSKSVRPVSRSGQYDVDFYDVTNSYSTKMQSLLDGTDLDEDKITYVYVPVESATQAEYEFDLKRRKAVGYASVALVAEWKWKRDENNNFVKDETGQRIKEFTGKFKYVKIPVNGEYQLISDELTNEVNNEEYNKQALSQTPAASTRTVDPDRIFTVHWPITWGVPDWDAPGVYSESASTKELTNMELGETPIIFDVTTSLNLKNLVTLKQFNMNAVKDLLCGARDTKDYWKVKVNTTLPYAIGYKNNVKLIAYNEGVSLDEQWLDLTFGNATGMLYPITEESTIDQLVPAAELNLKES